MGLWLCTSNSGQKSNCIELAYYLSVEPLRTGWDYRALFPRSTPHCMYGVVAITCVSGEILTICLIQAKFDEVFPPNEVV